MKKITIILLMAVCLQSYAQDSQLFENTWYLQNIIIDGQNYTPPVNEELPYVTVDFYDGPTDHFSTRVCDAIAGDISFDTENSIFTFDNEIEFGFESCVNQINTQFENIYFDFYLYNNFEPFTYLLTTNATVKTLTINTPSNDQAVYINTLLANLEFNNSSFLIYPNPTTELLNINSKINIEKIQIFDMRGRKVLEENNPTNSINISKLSSGLLFVQLHTKHGFITKKIVKE